MIRSISETFFERAGKVIPGGIYGHVSPGAGLPENFPHYCQDASGCRFRDVDAKEWIDFMCGFGAVLHGFRNPCIEKAVEEQRKSGSIFNQPSPLMIDLAERLIEQIDFAQWAVFAKNGSDLTTWAIRVAREQTGKQYIIKATGAYHGVDAWCDPGFGGRISSDRQHILEFKWNQIDQLEDLTKKYSGKVAGLILTPYHHPSFSPSELPLPQFWENVEEICNRNEMILILDDVRCGGRLHDQGSHRYFGFSPDLAVYSKALGNGYAISACVGREDLRESASEVFLTGSCWNDAYSMAAAIASLKLSIESKVAQSVLIKGLDFSSRLERVAQEQKIPLRMTGPPSMPYPWIEGDNNLFELQKFCRFCADEGLYFHPHHNWFISNSLDDEAINETMDKVSLALEKMKRVS
jgi:glutamate-1-semialdehyde 2,1-aminomutase